MHPPARSRSRGFTLIEILVAMGILLIGMTSVLGLLSFGAALTRGAALRGASASVVEAIVADLETGLFPLILQDGEEVAGPPVEIKGKPVPGHAGLTYSAVATPDPDELELAGGPIEYRVDVEVRWSTGGRERTRTFTTLILRELAFGDRLRRRFVAGEVPTSEPARLPPRSAATDAPEK